jgi:hypothetical protein
LDGTRFEALATVGDILNFNTGDPFHDNDEESVQDCPELEWERGNVEALAQGWLKAQLTEQKVEKIYIWLEEDPPRHFAELRGGGIARLLSSATRENCGLAIHYSYPSFHGTWIADGKIVDLGDRESVAGTVAFTSRTTSPSTLTPPCCNRRRASELLGARPAATSTLARRSGSPPAGSTTSATSSGVSRRWCTVRKRASAAAACSAP